MLLQSLFVLIEFTLKREWMINMAVKLIFFLGKLSLQLFLLSHVWIDLSLVWVKFFLVLLNLVFKIFDFTCVVVALCFLQLLLSLSMLLLFQGKLFFMLI